MGRLLAGILVALAVAGPAAAQAPVEISGPFGGAGPAVQDSFKADGNFDRNCSLGSQTANRVYVRHDDGLTVQYLHLKSGSLTSKTVGDRVAQGEYIGVVGSSGSSSGPHLHFEVVDGSGNVVDPFVGSCNAGTLTWPGGSIPIVRYGFAAPTITAPAAGSPEAGWWWTPNQGGAGFFLEVQGAQLFLAAYMYRDAGAPVWYTGSGTMASTSLYEGDLTEFAGGQPVSGTYRPPSGSTPMGRVAVQFTSTTTGTLTLPNGQRLPIARFSQF